MMRPRVLVAFLPAFVLAACSSSSGTTASTAAKNAPPAPSTPSVSGAAARAEIEAKSGSTLSGSATFKETAEGVHVIVDVTGAPEGTHAVHLHQNGDCSAPDAMSAGGHFNPTGAEHGAPDAPMHHAGDFGNMTVGADGKGHLEVTTKMLTVAPGPNSVMGRAIVVHSKEDDMHTQPTGNAGGRIGCGVVKS